MIRDGRANESRRHRRAAMLATAGVCLEVTVLAYAGVTASGAVRDGLPAHNFGVKATRSCLLHRAPVPPGSTFALGMTLLLPTPSYYPPRIVGAFDEIGLGHVDLAHLFFFRTRALARKGVAKLVALWVYGRGWPHLPPEVPSVGHLRLPPNPAAASRLVEIYRNVVVIWAYPRRYSMSSERLLRACL